MRAWRWMVVGLVLVWMAGIGRAETQDEVTLAPVVVTASREKEKVLDVPAHVTVIDSTAIEASTARYIPELLAPQGIQVRDIASNKRTFAVDLRGFGEASPANLLVMVDGRRINQADLSGTDWTLIPLERIERIEIIRGSRGSVLYGDNATAGVVNIITKTGQKLQGRASVAYGSYETLQTYISAGAAGERISLDLSGSYLDSDGYRENSDTEAKSLGLSLGIDPSDTVVLNFSGGYHQDDTAMPGAILQSQFDAGADRTDTMRPDDFAKTEDYYAAGSAEFFILSGDAFKIDTGLRKRAYDSFFSGNYFQFKGNDELSTWNVSPHFTFKEAFGEVANRIVFGWEYSDAKLDIDNWSWNTFSGASQQEATLKKENGALYVHDQLNVNSAVSLSGGFRHDRAFFSFDAGDHTEVVKSMDALNLGVNYTYAPKSHIYAEYSEGFRYPLLDEFFNRIYNTVARSLKPQRSYTYEIGLTHALAPGLFFDGHLFKIDTADEIFYNADITVSSNQNLDGDTERRGVEAGLRYTGEAFSSGIRYTYTKAEVHGGRYAERVVPGVPEHQVSMDAAYTFPFKLYLGLNAVYVGERYFISDLDNVADRQADYTVVNAKIKYPWRWLSFFVDLNNIFNETYSSYGVYSTYSTQESYYPSPQFNVLVGVTTHWPK